MILHDWAEQDCHKTFAKRFDALPSGGQIILSDQLVDNTKNGPVGAARMSLNMRIEAWGRNYTAAEYGAWLTAAGFTSVHTIRFDAPAANGAVARKP